MSAYFEEGSEALQQLEAMIDKVGTRNVAYAVAQVCALKAAHLAENWQDNGGMRAWDRCAGAWSQFAQNRCPASPLD